MANRLTKIYTRTGDAGETGAADGTRIAKDNLLMHVQGDIDELNSLLGVMASHLKDKQLEYIRDVQHVLFDIGGEISLAASIVGADEITSLEQHIDAFNENLEPLKEFILPGGNQAGSLCHLARTVCRRAERNMVSLSQEREVNSHSLAYINRLSDFLFVFSRILNNKEEIYWRNKRGR